MGRFVIYNGKGVNEPNISLLEKGKRYEVESETLDFKYNVLRLKGLPGEFNTYLFDDCGEGIFLGTKVMKPVHLAKITIYRDDFESCVGMPLRLRKLEKGEMFVDTVTTPIKKVEHIYSNIYKVETENTVYIVEVNKRTVG